MVAARWGGWVVMLLVAVTSGAACGVNAGGSQTDDPAVLATAQAPGAPTVDPTTAMFDQFDGPAGSPPDPAKWTVTRGTGWDTGVEDYMPGNAVLDGKGHLLIRAVKTATGYTSGRVQTKDLASFGYGTLTARIKMPAGQGLWPAFWLVGADEENNPWPGAGEINIVEMISDPQKRYSSIHGPISGVSDYLQSQVSGPTADMSTGFRNYWMTHSRDSITMGVDDVVWATFTPDSLPPGAQWVFNKPFYVILNLSVGGSWAGLPDETTPFPAAMLVDWVHWQSASR